MPVAPRARPRKAPQGTEDKENVVQSTVKSTSKARSSKQRSQPYPISRAQRVSSPGRAQALAASSVSTDVRSPVRSTKGYQMEGLTINLQFTVRTRHLEHASQEIHPRDELTAMPLLSMIEEGVQAMRALTQEELFAVQISCSPGISCSSAAFSYIAEFNEILDGVRTIDQLLSHLDLWHGESKSIVVVRVTIHLRSRVRDALLGRWRCTDSACRNVGGSCWKPKESPYEHHTIGDWSAMQWLRDIEEGKATLTQPTMKCMLETLRRHYQDEAERASRWHGRVMPPRPDYIDSASVQVTGGDGYSRLSGIHRDMILARLKKENGKNDCDWLSRFFCWCRGMYHLTQEDRDDLNETEEYAQAQGYDLEDIPSLVRNKPALNAFASRYKSGGLRQVLDDFLVEHIIEDKWP